jgi:peptide/nickel transport system permease protein
MGSLVFARLGEDWRLVHRVAVLTVQLSGIVLVTWLLLSMAGVQPSLGQANAADSGAAQARELALLNRPVLSVLIVTAERSITLMAFAAAWATCIGIGLASVNSAVRDRHFGWAVLAAGALWITPTFMLAILIQQLQAVIVGHTGLVVAAGFGDVNGVQIFWASIVLGLRPVAYLFRHSRNLLQLETLHDYVRTAQAKGLDWRDVVFRHIFRVALPGLLTIWLNSFRLMIGALPLVEFFFGYPGLGRVLVLSLGLTYLGRPTDVGHPHGDLALGLVVIMATLLLVVEIVTRLLQEAVDPRLRAVRAES